MAQLEISSPQAESNLVAASSRFSRLGDNPDVADILIGAWQPSFNPTIDQGATANITHTLNLSEWRYDGPMIDWCFYLTLTGNGTVGSAVLVDLPVAALSGGSGPVFGSGIIYDASATTIYTTTIGVASTTQIVFWTSVVAGVPFGQFPTTALANGDQLRGTVRYRWA